MDKWLSDQVKTLFYKPCLEISTLIGKRLENRINLKQSIDERALTEDLIDSLDTNSNTNAWGTALTTLRQNQIYVNTKISKSTIEFKTGADIGVLVSRNINNQSKIDYSALIQCKRVDEKGIVKDFFHQVPVSKRFQSSLLLEITPSSFYFIFTPPSLLNTHFTFEPMAFISSNPVCSSPIWNIGKFEHGKNNIYPPFLSTDQINATASILVVPAIAVEGQVSKGKKLHIEEILSNCMPFWYWFGELLIPGFVGDSRVKVRQIALNTGKNHQTLMSGLDDIGVNYSLTLSINNG